MPQSNNIDDAERLRATRILLVAGFIVLLALAMLALRPSNVGLSPESQSAAAAATFDPFGGIQIHAQAAIVVDLSTGETLYEKNPAVQLPLASLAKAALAVVVSESLPAETVIVIPHYIESSTGPENLTTGETWRVQDVLDFTLVTSSNGGAEALAAAANESVRAIHPSAPSEKATLWRMNKLAEELGMSETFFLNVSGLDESETLSGAYGSARDVATLFTFAYRNYASAFQRTAQSDIRITSPSGAQKKLAYNTNDVLGEVPGLILGKTGLTDLAGGNLAVVFDVGLAHPVVAVVLGSSREGRFADMKLLIDSARAHVSGPAQ